MDFATQTVFGVIVILFLCCIWLWICFGGYLKRQKTRNTQARRVFAPGTRQRQLSVQGEPTIFVSPANLPPPPKYEAMAPPSYEEVMGVHYPYQSGQQPITYPLTHAPSQSSSSTDPVPNVTINVTNNVGSNVSRSNEPAVSVETPAVVTVRTEETRTSVAVRA